MDSQIYLAVNRFVVDHDWLGRAFGTLETWAVPVFALATVALWFLDRPGGPLKWRLASASALASAAVALLVARVIGTFWPRERPFAAHPGAHVWGARSHDPSFPSDHASAAHAVLNGVCFVIVGTAMPPESWYVAVHDGKIFHPAIPVDAAE